MDLNNLTLLDLKNWIKEQQDEHSFSDSFKVIVLYLKYKGSETPVPALCLSHGKLHAYLPLLNYEKKMLVMD